MHSETNTRCSEKVVCTYTLLTVLFAFFLLCPHLLSMELLLETALYFLRAFASCGRLLFLFLLVLYLQLKVAASLLLFLSLLLLPLFSLPHVAVDLLLRDRLRLGLGHRAWYFTVVLEPTHAVGAVAGIDRQNPAPVRGAIPCLEIDV